MVTIEIIVRVVIIVMIVLLVIIEIIVRIVKIVMIVIIDCSLLQLCPVDDAALRQVAGMLSTSPRLRTAG